VPTVTEGYVLTRLYKKSYFKQAPSVNSLGAFFSVKCYGSTSVSKTESRGSTPRTDANIGEWPNGRATDFDSGDCRFESYFPSQSLSGRVAMQRTATPCTPVRFRP
jgi:hypothetical protein